MTPSKLKVAILQPLFPSATNTLTTSNRLCSMVYPYSHCIPVSLLVHCMEDSESYSVVRMFTSVVQGPVAAINARVEPWSWLLGLFRTSQQKTSTGSGQPRVNTLWPPSYEEMHCARASICLSGSLKRHARIDKFASRWGSGLHTTFPVKLCHDRIVFFTGLGGNYHRSILRDVCNIGRVSSRGVGGRHGYRKPVSHGKHTAGGRTKHGGHGYARQRGLPICQDDQSRTEEKFDGRTDEEWGARVMATRKEEERTQGEAGWRCRGEVVDEAAHRPPPKAASNRYGKPVAQAVCLS